MDVDVLQQTNWWSMFLRKQLSVTKKTVHRKM